MNPLCWTDEQWLEWNDMGEPSVEAFFTMKHQLNLFGEVDGEAETDTSVGDGTQAA